MASTPLTLMLDGEDIDPLSVGIAIRAFIQLLAEIDREVSPTVGRSARFRLTGLSYASPATISIAIEPLDENMPDSGPQIAAVCVTGLRLIEVETIRPVGFSDDALEQVADLGAVMNDGVHAVAIETPVVPVPAILTLLTPKHVGDVLAQGYSIGGVEGQLDAISIHGQPYFTLYDSLSGRAVRCFFRPDMQHQVINALGSKVFVHGNLRRDVVGRPSQLRDIDEFTRLGEATSPVPSPNLPGALKGIEGSTQEYLAKIRGESN